MALSRTPAHGNYAYCNMHQQRFGMFFETTASVRRYDSTIRGCWQYSRIDQQIRPQTSSHQSYSQVSVKAGLKFGDYSNHASHIHWIRAQLIDDQNELKFLPNIGIPIKSTSFNISVCRNFLLVIVNHRYCNLLTCNKL